MPIAFNDLRFGLSGLLFGLCFISPFVVASGFDIGAGKNCSSAHDSCNDNKNLQVASPDWRDQIIYFLMIDRFNDGDPSNNDQGAGVFKAGAHSMYNGGDLNGIVKQLDYIQDLGATAVWTTPQVANQWWDPIAQYWGYHGYWARNFKQVDEHYGTLADYQALSKALHGREMYLIQDIVVNHTGNFFYYDGEYDLADPTANFHLNSGSLPTATASQFPLNLNNALDPQQCALNVFNWTPQIKDNSDPIQEARYQLSGLDDLNTRNPLVREMLKDAYSYWIEVAGVDAFRIDTAKYVEAEFYRDFLHSDNGILATAAKLGKQHFLTFGEFFEMSSSMGIEAEQKIKTYLGDKTSPLVESPIGFPLYQEMQNVFISGRPTAHMSFRLKAAMQWYTDPYVAVNFIDNHDVERFLSRGTMAGFKQAYALMMTVPGIPTIYQGDEQAHKLHRQAMFAGGYGSKQTQFDPNASMYKYIQSLAKMRLANKVFSRGSLDILRDNQFGPGILAYRRDYQSESAFVVFNSADQPALLANLPTGYTDENEVTLLFTEQFDQPLAFTQNGMLSMELPARSVLVFKGKTKPKISFNQPDSSFEFDPIPAEFLNVKQATISGRVKGDTAVLKAIVDGDLGNAKILTTDSQGQWEFSLAANGLGSDNHSLQIYWPQKGLVSTKHDLRITSTEIDAKATANDPIGDDKGTQGDYQLPGYQQDDCFMDIQGVEARAGGSNLHITLTMCDISTAWGPANGFDHVAFTLYMDMPDKVGKYALPLLNANMPEQGDWDYAHSTYGWGNYLFDTRQASDSSEGQLYNYSPKITVDKAHKQIHLHYEGQRFGVTDWRKVSIFITTWDKDESGTYREINTTPSRWHFASASNSNSKIADSIQFSLN